MELKKIDICCFNGKDYDFLRPVTFEGLLQPMVGQEWSLMCCDGGTIKGNGTIPSKEEVFMEIKISSMSTIDGFMVFDGNKAVQGLGQTFSTSMGGVTTGFSDCWLFFFVKSGVYDSSTGYRVRIGGPAEGSTLANIITLEIKKKGSTISIAYLDSSRALSSKDLPHIKNERYKSYNYLVFGRGKY